jgi:starch synthase
LKKKSLKILFLAAEAEPFIKIGGLGDVAGSLPKALKALSLDENSKYDEIDIRLVIPFHGAIQRHSFNLKPAGSFSVASNDGDIYCEALTTQIKGVPVYLLSGPPIPRDAPVYREDTAVDGYKFTFFSLAALELARHLNWQPDILHANDWHTAPSVYALKIRNDPFFENTATLLGLHNLPFMGENAGPALEAFGLPLGVDTPLPWWAQSMPLPLGLLAADHIVAVSPAYAKEILTHEYGAGLEDFLKSRSRDISGILNGIDTGQWDPAKDKTLTANFTAGRLDDRMANKTALLKEFKLNPDPQIPLLTMVTRIDPQKGVDLVPVTLRLLAHEKWQAIILGNGVPELEAAILELENEMPDRVRAAIRFDSLLSHRLYAGADAIMIPSRYEPCGLTQMFGMRYGCVPIARATGGLRDTIHDHNAENKNGFLFTRSTSKEFSAALRRAFTIFEKKDIWQELQHNGMAQDFSWEGSAHQYLKLYSSLKEKPPR